MRRPTLFAFALLLAIYLALPLPTIPALIVGSGDVSPLNPSDWISATTAYIGKTSIGSVTVDLDSDLKSKYGYIGDSFGSTGEVTVDGTGSTWSNFYHLYVGHSGGGTLKITRGGTVSDYYGYIGDSSGSTGEVTVDGFGSTWSNSSSLCVGNSGNGTLNITGGGKVSNTNGYIGDSSGSTGAVTVDGPARPGPTVRVSMSATLATGR